jgi:hypothetical protein
MVDILHINKLISILPSNQIHIIRRLSHRSFLTRRNTIPVTKDSDQDTNIIRSNEECITIEYITYTPSDNDRVD